MEALEIVCHEGCESITVFGWDVCETAINCFAKFDEVIAVSAVEHVAFDELPQTFNQVEVGGIRRQKLQPDVERRGQIDDQSAVLISCVVQHLE